MIGILTLALLCGSACAAVSVHTEDTAALLEDNGRVILALGIYDDIVPLGRNLYAAGTGGLYALISARGLRMTDMVYSYMAMAENCLIVKRDGQYGALSFSGSVLVPMLYTRILTNGSGGYLALRGRLDDDQADRLFYIDAGGGEHETPFNVLDMGLRVASGRLNLLIEGGYYIYCDARGARVGEQSYEYAGIYTNGLAAVVSDGRYGAIDPVGNYVVPADYDFLEMTDGGVILAHKRGEGVKAFSADGKCIFMQTGDNWTIGAVGAYFMVTSDAQTSLYDANAAAVWQGAALASCQAGVNGGLIVSEGAWGESCVHLLGSEVLYQNLTPLGTAQGQAIYACLSATAARYMNDLLGELQYSWDADSVRYGVVDATGEALTECRYLSLAYLADDRLLASDEQGWYLIDARGTVLWSDAASAGRAPDASATPAEDAAASAAEADSAIPAYGL